MEEGDDISDFQKNLEFVKTAMVESKQTEEDIESAFKLLSNDPKLAAQTARNFKNMRKTQVVGQENVILSALQELYNKKNQESKSVKSSWTYKRLRKSMKNQYDKFVVFINEDEKDGWDKVDLGEHSKCSLWEKQNDNDNDIYILKASCQMDVDPSRVMTLMTNTDYNKRMRWDPDNLCQVNKTAENGSIEIIPGIRLLRSVTRHPKITPSEKEVPLHQKFSIVESYIKPPTMFANIPIPGVSIRRYLTSQWVFHNKEYNEWVILTHSLKDSRYPLFDGMVDATGFGGVRIEYDNEEKTSCIVTIIAHINPGGNIPQTVVKWGKSQLVTLLGKINSGCEDELYTEIYGK